MPFQIPTTTVGIEIDDAIASTSKTYSSSKIVTELDKQITEPLPKLSSNNNKYLKYVHGSSPIWDTPSGGGSGSSTYLGLTDTPSTYSNNSLLYSTASGVAHTSTQIGIDGNGVYVNQLNARENNVSNIGDNTHKFNNVFCNNIHQGNVKLVIPSTRGSSGQYVKVNNASGETHTLEFFDILDDSAANNNTTYSSNKINTELATKSNTSHNHDDRYYTESESNNLLNGKIDKTSIQTVAEGNSTSETDVYSCNAVYSKNQIDTSVTSQQITVNNQTTAGTLNFGSNLTSGLYGALQTYVNSTRYSSIHHYATSGNCNIDWYLMKNNAETKTIAIRPNDGENVFEVFNGGVKAPIFQQRDTTTIIKLGQNNSASLGIPGLAIIPLVNTVNSQIQMRGLRNTGILGDSYVQHQSGSTLTIQSRIATNRHSTTHANIEVSTFQNGAETKVLDIGSNGSSKTITITGTTHGTGHFTTDQNNFTANDQLVTKQYVDAQIVAGGGASQFTQLTDTPSSYTANRFLKSTGSALDWFDLTSKTLTWDFYNALGDLPSASGNHGQIAHVHAEGAVYYAHNGSWVKLANDSRVDNSVSSIALSGNDLSVTRQDGSAFLVVGVKPPQLSFAVQGGTVSNNGATLQLSQTNGSPAAITGLTPSTVADGKTLTSGTYDLGAGTLSINQQDLTSITITGCPRPLSSYNAGAGNGNYYTPSFLNDRILPAVSSGTNQYVLGNDGSGPLWLSTLQAGSTTLNIGTSTVKKFAIWAGSTFLEYFMKATPSNGDTLGSVAFSDTSLNNYATFSGKVDDNSTRAGHFSFSTAFNNLIVEKLLVGKSDHSGSDAGQFKGVLKTDGIKFSGNTTQTKPVEDPATVGHVLTATAGGNWQWAAASGGGGSSIVPTWTQTDVSSLTKAQMSGIGWNDRVYSWHIDESNFIAAGSSFAKNEQLFNGDYDIQNDTGPYFRRGGVCYFEPFANVSYNFGEIYLVVWTQNYSGSFASPSPTLILEGSNDKYTWNQLFSTAFTSFTLVSSGDYSGGTLGVASGWATYRYTWTRAYYHFWRFRFGSDGYLDTSNTNHKPATLFSLKEIIMA